MAGPKAQRAHNIAVDKQTTRESSAPRVEDFDTQLMLRVREGDRDAANALVRRNFPRISRYIERVVHDRRPVEDLTQDVFLQALSHASDYRPTAKVVTWLYRIATNTALNYLKQPAGKRNPGSEPAATLPDHRTAPPEHQLSVDELRREVADALGRLPVSQRVALTLFQYEGCSYDQIAAVLETTVEAVRSLLLRARTTLRRELQGLI